MDEIVDAAEIDQPCFDCNAAIMPNVVDNMAMNGSIAGAYVNETSALIGETEGMISDTSRDVVESPVENPQDDMIRLNGASHSTQASDCSDLDAQLSNGQDADVRTTGGSTPAFRGEAKPKHWYCPVCGHTWYAPGWPNYCPKSGCNGSAKEM